MRIAEVTKGNLKRPSIASILAGFSSVPEQTTREWFIDTLARILLTVFGCQSPYSLALGMPRRMERHPLELRNGARNRSKHLAAWRCGARGPEGFHVPRDPPEDVWLSVDYCSCRLYRQMGRDDEPQSLCETWVRRAFSYRLARVLGHAVWRQSAYDHGLDMPQLMRRLRCAELA